jgi:hypothetical protein
VGLAGGAVLLATAPKRGGAPVSLRKKVGATLLGFGGAGIALGAVAGGYALHFQSDLSSSCMGGSCPPDDSLRGKVAGYDSLRTMAVAELAIGAVALGAGAVLVATAKPPADARPAAEGVRITPYAGLGGLGARGSF